MVQGIDFQGSKDQNCQMDYNKEMVSPLQNAVAFGV